MFLLITVYSLYLLFHFISDTMMVNYYYALPGFRKVRT